MTNLRERCHRLVMETTKNWSHGLGPGDIAGLMYQMAMVARGEALELAADAVLSEMSQTPLQAAELAAIIRSLKGGN